MNVLSGNFRLTFNETILASDKPICLPSTHPLLPLERKSANIIRHVVQKVVFSESTVAYPCFEVGTTEKFCLFEPKYR